MVDIYYGFQKTKVEINAKITLSPNFGEILPRLYHQFSKYFEKKKRFSKKFGWVYLAPKSLEFGQNRFRVFF